MYDSDDFSSSSEECEKSEFVFCVDGVCPSERNSGGGGRNEGAAGLLPFDPAAIEIIILSLSDQFNMNVVTGDRRVDTAMMVAGGLTLAGTVIGKHYAGNMGAVVGGAVGGACGIGIAVVSLREIWEDVKSRLWEMYEVAYDFLVGMGIHDYQTATDFLIGTNNGGAHALSPHGAHLAQILAEVASALLKKKVTTTLMN